MDLTLSSIKKLHIIRRTKNERVVVLTMLRLKRPLGKSHKKMSVSRYAHFYGFFYVYVTVMGSLTAVKRQHVVRYLDVFGITQLS